MSERLIHPESGPEFTHALTDFTLLFDQRKASPSSDIELIDWIATFQAQRLEHALDRWRAQPNDAWLLAALECVPRDNPAVPDLLDAAHKLPATNPAWASAAFYGISLEMARGELDRARSWADQALTAKTPADVRNQLLAVRLELARNWEEFLRYAPRTPVAVGIDTVDEPIEFIDPPLRNRKSLLDADFTAPFNREIPLDRWVSAASSPLLPAALEADIAQAGWVRAVVLGRIPQAQAFAGKLAALRPQLAAPLQAWLDEKDPQAARFQAALLLLRTPGLQPIVRDNFGRETGSVEKIDQFRDNWWDLGERVPVAEKTPRFLGAAEKANGQKEWLELQSRAMQASDYLCGEAVAWARAHPDDPRVPEALHLAVRTTRFTSGQHTTPFPKQAFTLLHVKYPASKWTALTPYWY